MGLTIAYLEDDLDQAELVRHWAARDGHHCHHYVRGADLLAEVADLRPDLLLLDWFAEDTTGEQVMGALGARVSPCPPVLFVTAHNERPDLVRVLRAGACDYLPKPVNRDELRARLLAYGPPGSRAHADLEPYALDAASGAISVGGHAVALDEAETALARVLFSAAGRLVARDELLAALRALRPDAETRAVDAGVSRVRAKLRISPARGWQLRSVLGYGFRLERVAARAAQAPGPGSRAHSLEKDR